MIRCMDEDFGNPSSLYQLGLDSEKIVKKARRQLESAASAGGQVFHGIFTSGGTEADNMAIFGTAKIMKRAGNRIVTTEVEHPAVLECCRELEKQGFEVIRVGVDRNCRLDMDSLEKAVNDRTLLVTIMHVNNETGTVMPVNRIRSVMKRKKAPGFLHCDAVQSFGKLPLPEGADLISVSGHKIHGPKGSGALLVRQGKTADGRNINLPVFIFGGGQEAGQRSGTENVPAIAGLGLAAEIALPHRKQEMKRMGELRELLRKRLETKLDDIIINSPPEIGEQAGMCCPSLLSVTFRGTRGEVLLHTLEQDGIYVSTGSACSSNKKGQSHVLTAMGLHPKDIEGTIRFSLGRFNTEEDIETAAAKTAEAVNRFRRLGSFR